MAGVLFDVDATDFVTASTTSSSAAESAVAARGSLQSALSGSSSMAGSDPTGQKWSESYDSAAADAVRGLDSIVTVLGSVSAGLAVTGYNYASADWQSAGQAGSPPGFTVPSLPSAVCSAPPPSSSGGTRASDIPGFEYVADFIGTMWPDGDTGKLTAAASAWTALADSLDTIKSSDLTRVVDGLDGTDTPEMPSIRDTMSQVQTAVGQLATEARSIATGCTDFAAQIESVHTQTRQELNNLLFQIEATVGASLLLTVVTAGASDVVGAGVVAGEVTFTVSRILTIIGEAAATVARVVDEVAVAAGSIARIAGISEQVTVRVVAFAGKSVVAGVGNSALNTVSTAITMPGADLNEAALSGFIGGAAFGTLGQGVKYGVDAARPLVQKASYTIRVSRFQSQLTRWAAEKGEPGYRLYGSLARDEWFAKYFQGFDAKSGFAQWQWPTGKDGFELGLSSPNSLQPGATITRLSARNSDGVLLDGKFATDPGTSFSALSLPPDRLAPNFEETTYEVLKPLPRSVREGIVDPGFEQTGRGMQYFFPDGLDVLERLGFIRKVS
ncbi:hypothetical protein ASF54_02110 [Frondihabitans sp. Leaf304]|nr:hypothetical protein ASF54_02110 [Frondihabitans sp. Leaf304]